MFYTGDLKAAYERMKHAAEFNMPPTKVTGSTIAQANDTFGNLIRITQLDRVRRPGQIELRSAGRASDGAAAARFVSAPVA